MSIAVRRSVQIPRVRVRSPVLPDKFSGMAISMEKSVRLAHSSSMNPREAAEQFRTLVAQPDMALVMFFCSSRYDLHVLAAELKRLFKGVQLVGCTTAGEIGPLGYGANGITGVSFSSGSFVAVTDHFDSLHRFDMSEGRSFGHKLAQSLRDKAPHASHRNSFGFMLIDGLSIREEPVARSLQYSIGEFPLFGGSAGDGLNFHETYVYADGTFRSDRVALTMISSPFPVRMFKTQHFVPSDRRLVITKADTAQRMVMEIDGLPAAEAYARLLEVELCNLNSQLFAARPVVVLIDGNNYVRSIQKVTADGSLIFYCAIEEGVVLRVARGVDLVANLEETFAQIHDEIGPPQLVLGCDCILRRLEIVEGQMENIVGEIFRRNNTIGFNTYGEQFRGVHVNQTLTGIAIGEVPLERCNV